MRLLKRKEDGTFVLTELLADHDPIPPYAVLSHTWGDDEEEVTFQDVTNGLGKNKLGYEKIEFCGEQASQDGLRYFWIDTCCIDKTDKAEVSRSINSMYLWYHNAAQCYVYLSDVSTRKRKRDEEESSDTSESNFRRSRWFTRGWTLQELLAPASVKFFSSDRTQLGDKMTLGQQIHTATNIPLSALRGDHLFHFSIGERMRWIEHRETKQEEDRAYSMLGIFGVHISPRYGEGQASAFRRLHEEIKKLEECILDLRLTDPRDDKKRIEDTKGGLLEGSYRWILENSDFKQWRSTQQSRLLWIKGDPGKGKTMLLCGIVDELENSMAKSDLFSYFFCQATDSRINNATAVLRGLIYLLVYQQPSLITHIRKKYDHAGKKLFEDANAWTALSEIFTDILQDPSFSIAYLVLDALDECTEGRADLLDLVARTSSMSQIRWLVSSCNWPQIEERLKLAGSKTKLSLELNADSVSAAVDIFIEHKVHQLTQEKEYNDKIQNAVLEYLRLNAYGTFLWVALVCQNLKTIPRARVRARLTSFPPGLNSFYERMITQISHEGESELYKQILATIATVYRPISLAELTSLVEALQDTTDDVKALHEIIGLCGSFLTVRDDTIYFVHQSAKDYLLEKAASEIFPSGITNIHHIIFSRSLKALSEILRRDVYGIDAPGLPIDQVQQPDPDPLISVRYSCVYWISHLLNGNAINDVQDGGSVDTFLRRNYLYWLEALSLCKGISEGILLIANLEAHIQVSS
jgi:NACHT domain/Heterokaryon incompatibility protein (HET)